MARNGAKLNCWAWHERSLPKKVRRAAKKTNAPRGSFLHWQPLGKVMASNGDDQLVVRWFPRWTQWPGSQVPIYFLAETLGLRFEKISYHFEGISMFRCCFRVNRKVGDAPVEPFDVWVECSLKA